MFYSKEVTEVNKAFKHGEEAIKAFKKECETDYYSMNVQVLFAQCVIALRELGVSSQDINKRLDIELRIYEDKQGLRKAR